MLATPAAPNFEPPPPQVADRRARGRRGTVGQLRQGSPARRRHGPPDYVQACGAQLIDQVLGAHSGEVEVSRPWQASATHNRLSEHCGDLLVRQGFVCLGKRRGFAVPCLRTYEELKGEVESPWSWPSSHLVPARPDGAPRPGGLDPTVVSPAAKSGNTPEVSFFGSTFDISPVEGSRHRTALDSR